MLKKNNKLVGWRCEKGFTQEAMAKALKVSKVTYSRKEENPKKLTLDQMLALSKKLKVPFSEFEKLV